TEAQFEALPLPGSLDELVRRRLDSLSFEARQVADVASVLGREIDERLLDAATGPELALTPSVEELLRRQVLEDSAVGRLRFVHDQIREVAYTSIPDAHRRQLHRAAAEA